MTDTNLLIRLRDICYSYDGQRMVLDRLNFTLAPNQRLGLIAPNGSGKTTLFHIIMGLLKPDSGSVEVFGRPMVSEQDFKRVRRRVGLMFQDADDQLFSPTVLEDVAFGPLNLGKSKADAVAISRRTLAFLGLDGFEDRITFKLSGGEKRLVALATVLAMEPEVLLLDEPSAGLDDGTKERLIGVLNQLDVSYVLVSHEFDFITEVTDMIQSISAGRIVSDSEAHLHRHAHAHQYGIHPHRHR
jgi:cobalt/nickel transport system ATP-binding protein